MAQNNTDYKLLAPIPGFDETYKTGDIGKYVNAIIKLSIVIAAVLAVVMITLGGFQYMTSESMGLKQEGKDKIKNAFLGLVILASSFLILNTINPALLNFNLNIQTVGVPGNSNSAAPSSQTTSLDQTTRQSRENAGLSSAETYVVRDDLTPVQRAAERARLETQCRGTHGSNARILENRPSGGGNITYTCTYPTSGASGSWPENSGGASGDF